MALHLFKDPGEVVKLHAYDGAPLLALMQHHVDTRSQWHAIKYRVYIHAPLYSLTLHNPQACADQINACVV